PRALLPISVPAIAPSQLSLKVTVPKVNEPNGVLHAALLSVVSPLATGACVSYLTVIAWLTDLVLPQPSVALHILVNTESQPEPAALVVVAVPAIAPSQLSLNVTVPKVSEPNGVWQFALLSAVSPLATGAWLSYLTVID